MPVTTIFVSGPPNSGKTRLIEAVASTLLADDSPDFMRLVRDDNCDGTRVEREDSGNGSLFRGCWKVPYHPDGVFEVLSEAIHQVRNQTKYVTMFLEADTDHSLRYAYTYSHRVFLMPAPNRIRDVFRSSSQAARALQEVMDDTAAFASEIFGVLSSETLDESEGVQTANFLMPGHVPEQRVDVSASQMRRFLKSPLGAEVVSRVQLQPEYHSLMENDIIVINTAGVTDESAVDQCAMSLRTMLSRVREGTGRHRDLFACDPDDSDDPRTRSFMRRFKELLDTPA